MFSIRWPFLKQPRQRLPRGTRFLPRIAQATTRRAQRWARRRQGDDPATVSLNARRTYILPTGVGLIYALMTFTMLLGSMNYNNNLSFVLTFFLIGLGFVAMHQCQRNLVGLDVRFAGVEPVFAGGVAQFRIAVTNRSRSDRFRIGLNIDRTASRIEDLAPGESRIFILPVPTLARGEVPLPRFGIRSLFPFELFRAWAWLHMDISGLAYPRPADDAPLPPPSLQSLGHRQHDARGEEDFAGLRRFVSGDSPRHVAWKAFARSGQLLSKRFAGADTSSQWFDFEELEDPDIERRLSILTRWIIEADRAREDYGLRLPGIGIAPSHGDAHRTRCLGTLARYRPSAC
jgi:uncharacterized protein (DUF58 family)